MNLSPTPNERAYGMADAYNVEAFHAATIMRSARWEAITTNITPEGGMAELERIRAGADIPECFRLVKVTREIIA